MHLFRNIPLDEKIRADLSKMESINSKNWYDDHHINTYFHYISN